MKNEGLRTLTSDEELDLGRKSLGNEVWSEREVFGKVRSQKGLREIKKNEMEIVLTLYIENPVSRWIKRCWELSRIKICQNELLRSYREVSTTKWPRWIEKLLSIYQIYRNFLDGSRSCRATIEIESQESRWIEITITTIEKGSLKGSIDSLAVERCLAAVKIA